jgi:hypothetical protein
MELIPILAAIDGGDVISQLLRLLLYVICFGLIYWVGRWFIGKLGLPDPAQLIWSGIFILIGVVIAINFLLSLAGRGFIDW